MTLYPDFPQPPPEDTDADASSDIPFHTVEDLVTAIQGREMLERLVDSMNAGGESLPASTFAPNQSFLARWDIGGSNPLIRRFSQDQPQLSQEEMQRTMQLFELAMGDDATNPRIEIGMRVPRYEVPLYQRASEAVPGFVIEQITSEQEPENDLTVHMVIQTRARSLSSFPDLHNTMKHFRTDELIPGIRRADDAQVITGDEPAIRVRIVPEETQS